VTSTRVVPVPALRLIVAGALRAPSVHNTQPWRWHATSRTLELHADRSRGLPATDPEGRNLVISCGAALHHAQVVAGALGWATLVERHPDPEDPDLLARLELSPAPPSRGGADVLAAVEQRCTDRRRFTSWPVPDERLDHLAAVANQWGTRAMALSDVTERFLAERLVQRAGALQRDNRAAVLEQEAWLGRGAADGIPVAALEDSGVVADAYAHRFETGPAHLADPDVHGSDGLVLLFAAQDDPTAWLRAGEGLSALWLVAIQGGLSVVPLSQVIEVAQTRAAFRAEVLGGLAEPLVLARVGWQPMNRTPLARTPRRPLDEVLTVG
jgi:hypothetical protein